MTTAKVKLPPKLLKVFGKPRGKLRYRGAYGGRGSGKSFSFAKMAAIFGIIEPLRILCTREFQGSIKESLHAELKNAIASEPWLAAAYDVGIDYLRGKNGTEFIFKGLRHNIGSIKSLAQIDICIVEEAEDIPEHSWVDLEPTIRAAGSEIWVIWNPRKDGSPVDTRLRKNTPPRSSIACMDYDDNPWFPNELEELRIQQRKTMAPETYAHIWEGAYLSRTESQIFKNKWLVDDFEREILWDGPYNGLDFGFSQDPTAAVQAWISDNCLYIEHEAGRVGLELDHTADYVCGKIPEFERQAIRADSARPESISYLRRPDEHKKRKHLSRIVGVTKGKGSVEDGVEFIKSFSRVVIHSRCEKTIEEFTNYSYKVDRLTGDVTSDIMDSWNHYIDALRYALQPVMAKSQRKYRNLL